MKQIALVIAATLTLLITGEARAGHNDPDPRLEQAATVQLNAFFPECDDMLWNFRVYMQNKRHTILRAVPKGRGCIGYRQFLVDFQGRRGFDLISLSVRERINLPYTGETTYVWVPFANIGY